jgi:hypothetical protein
MAKCLGPIKKRRADPAALRPETWSACCSKSTVRLRFFGSVEILLTVQGDSRFSRAEARKDVAMIEMITVFFGLFSAGIFLAHAFDGYRSRA